MTSRPPQNRMPDEGDLVRYLDGELGRDTHAWVEEWLERAPDLRESLALLKSASAAVEGALSELPTVATPPPPDWGRPTRPGRFGLARAAVFLIAAAGLLAAPPVRASLAQVSRIVTAWFRTPDTPSSTQPSGEGTAVVRTLPMGPVLAIRVEGAWPGGTLTLSASPDPLVSAVTSDVVEVFFSSGAVVFRFPAAWSGPRRVPLHVAVPTSVQTVEVHIPGEAVRSVDAPQEGDRVLELPPTSG